MITVSGLEVGSHPKDRNLPEQKRNESALTLLAFRPPWSPYRALAVRNTRAPERARAVFLEELIVRRELALNSVKSSLHVVQQHVEEV